MAKITKTGELREFLASTLNGVANGTVDSEKARGIVKLAAQINESFYSEIKIAKVRLEAGHEIGKLGDLPVGMMSD